MTTASSDARQKPDLIGRVFVVTPGSEQLSPCIFVRCVSVWLSVGGDMLSKGAPERAGALLALGPHPLA